LADLLRKEQRNRIYRNGQISVAGAGTGIVVESNDIVENNTLGYSAGWEAGATKFVLTDQLQVRNNCVRNNLGPGIWMDVENRNSTIVGNWSVRNTGAGIYNEIGGRALIEGNTAAFNGYPGETPWFSQILVSGSPDTRVQRNRVEAAPDYGHANFIVEEGRANYVSRRNVVAINDITFYGPMGVSGFHSSHGRIEDVLENNRFEGNSIHVVQGFTLLRFRIGREY
jgi:Right handed beta helix region